MATDAISIQKIYDRLTITPEQLKAFCIRWQIAELAVFGSILRDDFRLNDEIPSDIDLLFSDQENARIHWMIHPKISDYSYLETGIKNGLAIASPYSTHDFEVGRQKT